MNNNETITYLNYFLLIVLFLLFDVHNTLGDEPFDWQSDWVLDDYFTISIDSKATISPRA